MRAQDAVAEIGGERHAVVDHRDGFGGGEGAAGGFQFVFAVGCRPFAQFAENGDDTADFRQRRFFGGQLHGRAVVFYAAADDVHFFVQGRRQRQDDGVEAAFERAGKVVHAFVAVVGGGDNAEAAHCLYFVGEFGDGQAFFGEDGDEGVLHVGADTGQFFDAGDFAVAHGAHQRAFDKRRAARPFGEQFGVVPAVAQRFFAGAGGALHDEGGIAADGGSDVFAHPAFGRAGQAVEEEGAVGGKRSDGDFHQAAVTDVFGADGVAVVECAADEVGDDSGGRELPVFRTRVVVLFL